MKWIKRIFVCLLVLFIVLWVIAKSTTKYTTGKELKRLFTENENDFRRAAQVLTDVLSDNKDTISIYTTKYSADIPNDRIVVEQMKDLYFISYNTYSQDDYISMYDAVDVLLSSLEIEGISVTDEEIYFCISSYYGIVSDIIYRSDDEQPSVLHTVKEQEKISDGWYIVISHD